MAFGFRLLILPPEQCISERVQRGRTQELRIQMTQQPMTGLTSAEVDDRVRLGKVNRSKHSDWADYATIASRHLFTLFNTMVIPAAIALFYLREWQAGIAVSSMAIVNTSIGLFQELRAKRHLDRLSILVETKAKVIRDNAVCEIPASEVVVDDTLVLRAGDALVADGVVLEAKYLEVDEALLTGESDPVRRKEKDRLLSGSICVAGEGAYRAEKVGADAFVQSIASSARRYHYSSSPMTRVINFIIKILTLTAVVLCGLYFLLRYFEYIKTDAMVLMIAATITSMVPQGLVLTATVSFTLGALVMSRRGALVQRLNAVETMAAIDVICTDKTGTLTTNRLTLNSYRSLAQDLSDEELRRRMALFASATVDRENRNVHALAAAFGAENSVIVDQIPFKAQNRFSAVHLRDRDQHRILVLGAPEALGICMSGHVEASRDLQRQGMRVLVFAEVHSNIESVSLQSQTLPTPLRALALIALADELRPEAGKVLQALSAQGIAFKVISGDNPETIKATVANLDLPFSREAVVSGQELEKATDRSSFVEKHGVFGRIEPKQKVAIIEALQSRGHLVAMIGDGVNDVLPIKRSDLGIAMGEGSQAAKTVSSLVLENNNFALLPEAIEEGRTIVRNLRRAGKLFLVKNVYSLMLIVTYASGVFSLPFPYQPQQVTLLNWLVIGIPAFIIALTRERSSSVHQGNFLKEVGGFALRTGIVFGLAGLVMLALSKHVWADDVQAQRSMLLSVLILLGITALLRVLRDGADQRLKGDTRLRWLALGAIPAYLIAMYWPMSAHFFDLHMLDALQWFRVLIVVIPAYGLTLLTDRVRFRS